MPHLTRMLMVHEMPVTLAWSVQRLLAFVGAGRVPENINTILAIVDHMLRLCPTSCLDRLFVGPLCC